MSQLVRERIQRAEGRHTSGWGMGTGVSLRGAELPGMGTQARAVCRQELLGPAPSCLCLARLREASEDALDKARVSRGSSGLSRSKAASFACPLSDSVTLITSILSGRWGGESPYQGGHSSNQN